MNNPETFALSLAAVYVRSALGWEDQALSVPGPLGPTARSEIRYRAALARSDWESAIIALLCFLAGGAAPPATDGDECSHDRIGYPASGHGSFCASCGETMS